MKVLSVIKTTNSNHGGPPEVLKNQIDVINAKKKIIKILKLNNLSYTILIKCLFFRRHRLRIYNLLKKFDIIHFHEMWSMKVMLIVYFANKLLLKFLFVGHGYLDTWSINQKFFKKKLFIKFFLQPAYNSATASFFSTINELEEAKKNIKFHNSFIIPNGISLEKYQKRNLERKKKKKILFFGRIHEKKGLKFLLQEIKKLPENFFSEFSFEITGPGEDIDVKNFKNLIKKSNLQNKVKYNNPIYGKEKIEYLKKHDVFILPSFEEGDSIALKEALGSYLPVIISKQCRLNIVEKYKAGIVTETKENDLYEVFLKLKSLNIVQMGNQARKLIEDKYDNNECSNRLKAIYLDIFNETQNCEDWIYD